MKLDREGAVDECPLATVLPGHGPAPFKDVVSKHGGMPGPQRFAAVAAFADSSNTQIAAPWSGGFSISGTRAVYARDCEPPGPTTVATYSRPLTEYAIGTEAGTSLRRIFRSWAAGAASCAPNIRSRAETNTSPRAVAEAPAVRAV